MVSMFCSPVDLRTTQHEKCGLLTSAAIQNRIAVCSNPGNSVTGQPLTISRDLKLPDGANRCIKSMQHVLRRTAKNCRMDRHRYRSQNDRNIRGNGDSGLPGRGGERRDDQDDEFRIAAVEVWLLAV